MAKSVVHPDEYDLPSSGGWEFFLISFFGYCGIYAVMLARMLIEICSGFRCDLKNLALLDQLLRCCDHLLLVS